MIKRFSADLFGCSFASAKILRKTETYDDFIGLGYDEFSLLAEYDIVNDIMGADTKSNVLMVQTADGIITELDAIVRYDRIDPNTDLPNDTTSIWCLKESVK